MVEASDRKELHQLARFNNECKKKKHLKDRRDKANDKGP